VLSTHAVDWVANRGGRCLIHSFAPLGAVAVKAVICLRVFLWSHAVSWLQGSHQDDEFDEDSQLFAAIDVDALVGEHQQLTHQQPSAALRRSPHPSLSHQHTSPHYAATPNPSWSSNTRPAAHGSMESFGEASAARPTAATGASTASCEHGLALVDCPHRTQARAAREAPVLFTLVWLVCARRAFGDVSERERRRRLASNRRLASARVGFMWRSTCRHTTASMRAATRRSSTCWTTTRRKRRRAPLS
jgi:hypothetical protein